MYRKLTARYIFTGTEMLQHGEVLVTDGKGIVKAIITSSEAGEDVENYDGILCPGFINTHCHLELSHLKGLVPKHTGLVDFVYNIITQRNAEEAAILNAISKAEDEMLQNGIVAVGDICNTTHTVLQKKQERLRYHNFIETSGFVPAAAQQRFNAAEAIYGEFKQTAADSNSLPATITAHAPYSVSPQLFRLINNFSAKNLLSIHNQETSDEDAFFKTGTGGFLKLYNQLGVDISFYVPSGKTSLQTILPYLNQQQVVLLVHDVTTCTDDIEAAQLAVNTGQLSAVFYCLCPNANQYISNSLPDIKALVKNNCVITLGTDSLASNTQLSILAEMKTIQRHFPDIAITDLLQWATCNGAEALAMDDLLGSFETGKKPGVLLIEDADDRMLTPATTVKRIL